MKRSSFLLAWGYTLACAALTLGARKTGAPATAGLPSGTTGTDAAEWFRRVKPYCNAVEVATLQRQSAPPGTTEGAGYHAACFALAGRIDDARRVIDRLPPGDRYKAVGVVFDVGHPVADAGDDRSAGPIMEMVIDYWPNHYMALYHAGMAEYMLGQYDLARRSLQEFRKYYHENDGWTRNAVDVLERLRGPDVVPGRRPAEPQ